MYKKYETENDMLLYTYLNTLNGSSPIILEVTSSLLTVKKAEEIMYYSGLLGAIACILLILIIGVFIKYLITDPVSALTKLISITSYSHDLSRWKISAKNDEMSILSRECYRLISKYEIMLKRVEYPSGEAVAQPSSQRLESPAFVCEYCKKISNDNIIWTDGGIYIKSKSDTHTKSSICPDCVEKLNTNKSNA